MIRQANIKGQVEDAPGLQLNGVRATRARYPNLPGGIEVSPGYDDMIDGKSAAWTPPDLNKYVWRVQLALQQAGVNLSFEATTQNKNRPLLPVHTSVHDIHLVVSLFLLSFLAWSRWSPDLSGCPSCHDSATGMARSSSTPMRSQSTAATPPTTGSTTT